MLFKVSNKTIVQLGGGMFENALFGLYFVVEHICAAQCAEPETQTLFLYSLLPYSFSILLLPYSFLPIATANFPQNTTIANFSYQQWAVLPRSRAGERWRER